MNSFLYCYYFAYVVFLLHIVICSLKLLMMWWAIWFLHICIVIGIDMFLFVGQPWERRTVPPSLVPVLQPCPSWGLSWSWSPSFPLSWLVSLLSTVWLSLYLSLVVCRHLKTIHYSSNYQTPTKYMYTLAWSKSTLYMYIPNHCLLLPYPAKGFNLYVSWD